MVIILIWRFKKIKNLCNDLLDEYGYVDESLVDNEGSSHMPASTSNQVAQMKFRLSEAISSFDLFVNNSSQRNMGVLEWNLIISLMREC